MTFDLVYIFQTRNRIMSFRECVHCGREYEDVFNENVCSDECSSEIS